MHDVAWLAGLYEGEGNASIYKSPARVILAITSTDRDVLETAQRVAGGYGGITNVKRYVDHHKPCYRWQVSRREHVLEVCTKMLPYLHARRTERIQEVIDWCEARLARRCPTGQGWRTNGRSHHARA